MLLVAEILLTISAWRSGWKGWALLPMGICYTLAFLFGYVIGVAGADVNELIIPCMMLDVMSIITLIIMRTRKRTNVHENRDVKPIS